MKKNKNVLSTINKFVLIIILCLTNGGCLPVKMLNGDNYPIEDGLTLNLIKYYEPPNTSFVEKPGEKFIIIVISIENKTNDEREVDFSNFSVSSDKSIFFPLFRVIKPLGEPYSLYKRIKFKPLETKKLFLEFSIPSEEENIRFLRHNKSIINLEYGETKNEL